MRVTIRLFILLALALGVFGQYGDASAADVVRTSGLSAMTYFSGTDPTGCIYTSVFVQGIHHLYKNPPGLGEATSIVYLSIYQQDYCIGQTVYIYRDVLVDQGALVIDKKLGWTTLNTTITAFNLATQSNVEIALDLTWTATGSLVVDKIDYKDNTPHCHWMMRSKGPSREAEASGTITYGGTTINLDSSWNARIWSFKAGNLTIGCE
jgi:hypothetical protein